MINEIIHSLQIEKVYETRASLNKITLYFYNASYVALKLQSNLQNVNWDVMSHPSRTLFLHFFISGTFTKTHFKESYVVL